MATQRKSTGSTPLIDMIMEVYDTKQRMKAVINKVIETDSDDFEEYATLTHNFISIRHNHGVEDGYNDGWHAIFPGDQLDPSVYEEYYWSINTFTPSIPSYSTGEDIDNLVVVMTDNLRCRELLKVQLFTQSDEFVTYPDLLDALYDSAYQDAYDYYFDLAYNAAIEAAYQPPTIKQHKHKIEIINNADFGTLYYWTGNETIDDKHLYTGQFELNTRQMVYAVLYHDGRYSRITSYLFIIPEEEEFTFVITEDIPTYSKTNSTVAYIILPQGVEQTNTNIEFSINDGAWHTADHLGGSFVDKSPIIYLYYGSSIITSDYPEPSAIYEINKGDRIRLRGNCTYYTTNVSCCFYTNVSDSNQGKTLSKEYLGNYLSLFSIDYLNLFDLNNISGASSSTNRLMLLNTGSAGVKNVENTALTATTLKSGCYSGLFGGCLSEEYPDLPATTLASGCYYSMFSTSNIKHAPNLPATILANNCYENMFDRCTNLISAPVISATTLATECCWGMFFHCTALTTAPTLSATTLTYRCYDSMFKECTSLTTTPALPAITMAEMSCYSMYEGCTSLVNVGDLSATTLDKQCCMQMFKNCISLITAPALPATTLAKECYELMFEGCTSLITAPALNATTLANSCYNGMFSGCTSLTNVPTTLPATTLVDQCYSHMFNGCTALEVAPILPAETLISNCYYGMFIDCISLHWIKCLATSGMITGQNTEHWVEGVASYGTFVKAENIEWPTAAASNNYRGIPSGWEVQIAA